MKKNQPSFRMEKNKESKKDIFSKLSDEISRQLADKNGTFSKGNSTDSMTMPYKGVSVLWRPNNYRRQMDISIVQYSTLQKIKSTIFRKYPNIDPKDIKLGKILSIRNIGGCTIQVGKTKITAILSQKKISGVKETFCFQGSTREEIDLIYKDIEEKKEKIRQNIDSAIFEFCDNFNLWLGKLSKPSWQRCEDWFRGSEMIEKLPVKSIVYEKRWKKVYGNGVEFTESEPTKDMIRHINNSVLIDLVPEIVERLDKMEENIRKGANPLRWLKNKITKVSDLFKFDDVIKDLNPDEKRDLENHLLSLEV